MTPRGRWLSAVAAVLWAAPAAYSQLSIVGSNTLVVTPGQAVTLEVTICPGFAVCHVFSDVNINFTVSNIIYGYFPPDEASQPTVVSAGFGPGDAMVPLETNALVGSYTVTATGDGGTVTFYITNQYPPVAVVPVDGFLSAPVGSAYPPLQAEVLDRFGTPLSGISVGLQTPPLTGTQASGAFPGGATYVSVTTAANGIATAPTVTANSVAGGPFPVSAIVDCSCSIANFSLTNTAAPVQYQLSASASPPAYGSISASPAGSGGSYSSGTYTATYNAGTMVQLTAKPASGYGFQSWGGGGVNGSTANPVTVTMNAAEDLTAFFVQVVPTTVTTNPPGLGITVDGQSYTAPQTLQLVQGTQHTIATSTPQNSANSRYTFANWSDGGTLSHTITVNFTPFTYTANFTGAQTSSPLSLGCGAPSGTAQVGSSYSLTCSASGGTAPYSFTLSSGTLPPGWNLSPIGSTVAAGGTATTAGPYSFTLQVTDAGSPVQTATQALSGTIAAGGTLSISPTSGLTFTAFAGRGNPATQTLSVVSSGGPVAFNVTNTPGWVQVSPSNGTANASPLALTVTALTNGLSTGPLNGTITIAPASGQLVSVNVSANVNAFTIGAASSIAEAVTAGAMKTDTLAVTTVDGSAAAVNASASTASGGNWLKLASSSLSAPGQLGFTVDAANLSVGPYTGSIALTCGSANPCAAVTVTLNLTVSAGTPTVAITQVLNATQEAASISQNTWIEIKGTNLSQTQRTWQTSDFDPKTGLMPTQLDGVSVTVNGKPAYVYYISSTQINVLTPIDSALGSVGVQVMNTAGSSSVFTATMLENSLGFFAFNSGQYAAAEHADGSYIGPTTLFPGLSTPAKPGETIVLYGNGFGETDPAINPGAAVQQGTLPHNPVITLGGLPMNVINAAVVSPGLYQFNVVVPLGAPDGDLALAASYNSYSTQSEVLLTVSH